MTREEVITALGDRNNLLWGMSKEEKKYYSEALDMAISALSENKGDLISRQAVLDELEKWDWQELYLPIHFKQILDDIPSVENKGEWIPVTERLPEDGQSVLFCDIDDDIMVGYHVKGKPATHFSQDGSYEDMKNVRAWQPLPEPYKAEKGGE